MASASQTPKVVGKTKGGKDKERTLRGFRPPRPEDDVEDLVLGKLKEKMPEWQVPKIIPVEAYPEQTKHLDARSVAVELARREHVTP